MVGWCAFKRMMIVIYFHVTMVQTELYSMCHFRSGARQAFQTTASICCILHTWEPRGLRKDRSCSQWTCPHAHSVSGASDGYMCEMPSTPSHASGTSEMSLKWHAPGKQKSRQWIDKELFDAETTVLDDCWQDCMSHDRQYEYTIFFTPVGVWLYIWLVKLVPDVNLVINAKSKTNKMIEVELKWQSYRRANLLNRSATFVHNISVH